MRGEKGGEQNEEFEIAKHIARVGTYYLKHLHLGSTSDITDITIDS